MIIEFDTIRSSLKESYERDIKMQTVMDAGMSSTVANIIPFERTQDYKEQVAIDMTKIVDFTGGRVLFNDTEYPCVYLFDFEGTMSNNILISYSDFKRVFEYAKGIKIIRHEEI